MEILPQKIGEFYKNDTDGFVINPASTDNIPHSWIPVIQEVKNYYIQNEKERLHSIYLRGSLVRGYAVEGLSDLDSFAIVFNDNLRWKDAIWGEEANKTLARNYDFISEVEFMLSGIDTQEKLVNSNIAMLIKTQSVCVHGFDLSSSIPKFKPDKSMMLNYRWIESDVENFKTSKDRTIGRIKEFLKVAIRTCFDIVMEKEKRYTPDLYLCYSSFSEYYPDRETIVRKMLYFYLNPAKWNLNIEKEVLVFCDWLVREVKIRLF